MQNLKQRGMSLIELVVTLTVVAILASLAAPSLQAMVAGNRLTAANNQLVSALNYARAEAVKRAYDVTMCVRASDGKSCKGSGSYAEGWIIFVDCNGDGAVATTNTCDSDADDTPDMPETILLDTQPDFNQITVTSPSNQLSPKITYQPNGKASAAGSLNLSTNATLKLQIVVALATGRIRSCKVPDGATSC